MTINKDNFANKLNELMNKFHNEVEVLCKNYSISCINALNGKMGATTQKHTKLQAQIALQEKQIQDNAKILEAQKKSIENDLLIQEKAQREKQAIQDNLQKTKTLKKLTPKKLELSIDYTREIPSTGIITDGSDTIKTSKTIESKPTIQNHDIKHRVIETAKKKPCNIYRPKQKTSLGNAQEVSILDDVLQKNKTSLKKARIANRLKSL